MSDRYRFILLETLIVGMIAMGVCIGIGSVKAETSFGVREVIGVLGVLGGGLAVFPVRRDESDAKKEEKKDAAP